MSYSAQLRAFAKRHGPPDSTVLPNRPASIRRFQRFHAIPVTGVVDRPTRRVMRKTHTRLDHGAYSYDKGRGVD